MNSLALLMHNLANSKPSVACAAAAALCEAAKEDEGVYAYIHDFFKMLQSPIFAAKSQPRSKRATPHNIPTPCARLLSAIYARL